MLLEICKLAIFVGSSNVANSIVENIEFRDLLSTLDPNPVPGKQFLEKN